jgi:predicted tellurium resistance membrane protein TerC
MNISIIEYRIWFIISIILFATAFIDRVGRPLIIFAITFFAIGIIAWLEHEWNEAQKYQEVEKGKQVRRMSEIAKKLEDARKTKRVNRQKRDSHGRFIRNIKGR